MSKRIVCFGEILWDRFPDGDRLGGAPANVAYHLGAIGAPVSMLSRVGRDHRGTEAIARLRRRGVDTGPIQRDDELPTGVVDVTLEGGEPRYSLREGCAWQRIDIDDDAHSTLAGASAFCFGTLAQMTETGMAAFRAAIAALPRSCLRVCDPNLRPRYVDAAVLRACLQVADVIKLNEVELRLIEHVLDVADAVTWLLGRGARLVAVTRGAAGSRLHGPGQDADHPGFPAEDAGDNVGAGDAYAAVLTASALADRSLSRTVEACNRYAAFVASRRGATPDPPAELVGAITR